MTDVATIDQEGLAAQTDTIIAEAACVVVVDQRGFTAAGEFIKQCKALEREIWAVLHPITAAAHAAHKAAKKAENEMLGPVQEAQKIVGDTMGDYQVKVEAERTRIADEDAQRAIEEAEAERAGYVGQLEAQGQPELADAAREEPLEIRHVATPDKPKVRGTASRTTWKFEVVDAAKLPRLYLMPDEKKIGQLVRTLEDQCEIPGVRTWAKMNVSAR